VRRSFLAVLASLVLITLALAAVIGLLIGTTSGMNTLLELTSRFTPVKIETQGSFGALTREFGASEVRVSVLNTMVEATELRARIHRVQRGPLQIDFSELAAKSLRVIVKRDPTLPTSPAQGIGTPVRLFADKLTLGLLTIIVGETNFSLQSLEGRVRAGPDGYRVEHGRLAYGVQNATLDGELGARRPFDIKAEAKLAAQVRDKEIGAALRASGSLVEMSLDGELSGAAQGRLAAVVRSFDRPAVKSLRLDLAGFDPRHWHPAAPTADLTIKAELTPNAAMDRVAGTVAVVNRAPGLIDAQRIPARSAEGRVQLDAKGLRIEHIAARLLQGTTGGEFSIYFADNSWQTRARLADVDPAQVHSALQSLRVSGDIQARRAAETIFVSGDLEHRGHPAASLRADAQFTAALATIHSARIALGEGFATAAGTVELADTRRTSLRGELQRFEPGLLVKGIDARLSGSFVVDGALRPKPAGQLRFELADSRAWGRPLAGHGRVDIDAAQRVEVDVDLAVRSAKLLAKGGLGASERKLDVTLEVPAIGELLPTAKVPVAGAVKVAGTLKGQWTAPEFDLKANGSGLRYGEHTLKTIEVDAVYGGGSDGALRLAAGATGYRYAPQPRADVQTAMITAEGRLSSHAIRIDALASRAASALVFADGGWRESIWRGRVREATIGTPVELRLLAPTALEISAKGFDFGPAQIAWQHVRFDDIRLAADAGGFATRGRFTGLQPMLLVPPVEGAMAPVLTPTAGRPELTFQGNWDLRLGPRSADGRVTIERSGGDLYAGRGPESALQLKDARLEAMIRDNRLEALARIESERRGGLGAHMDAWIENSQEAGWRLAQERPWLIAGAFDLPTMDWINALLSDHLRANVRLGGKLASSVRIEGTPAKPTATGNLTGTDLRVAWVEQGVRLENGSLKARLQDDLLVLDELRFAGPPRVRPDERRVAATYRADQDGTLSANGQLRLRDFSGVIQVAASDLPILQRPDRWIIASGGGNIETSAKHVQLNGAVAAQAGFVDFSRSQLPSLSSDVILVSSDAPAAARARRVTVGFDLGIDLGQTFYLRGSGLDTRVEGAVRLRSAGRGAVTAVGSIEAADGVYEGFGQKLKIARGRLNFQGAPENPGLDVLALRTGLPVQVGVTITRTAASPLIRLYSDPPMADVEALSWLVLGRPADQSRGDNIALVQAAAALLGGTGEGYPTRVIRALGFDELSIRSGTLAPNSLLPSRAVAGALRSDEASTATVAGEIVTLGKRISDALTVSYEQAISGTTRILQLNYQLSQRLSLVARTGTDHALDLVYTFAFD
jgi:translocation and assembly module TamB